MPASAHRPRLTLRVGITGHRSDRLGASRQLNARVRETLAALAAEARSLHQRPESDYAAVEPKLVIVSSLATGADSIAAAEGLAAGYALWTPLPFARTDFIADFRTPAERAEAERLLKRAEAILELDGNRSEAPAAYARAGRCMLDQSDVLIAVWDGDEAAPNGGTAYTVARATRNEVPVLWIDAAAPHAIRELTPTGPREITTAELRPAVARILEPLLLSAGDADDPVRTAYFAAPAPVAPALDALRTHADDVAQAYAKRYRDAFITLYLLGALAVAMALVGYVTPIGTIAELVLIATILMVTWRGQRGRWHARWLSFRLHAERLRHLELLRPLGRALPNLRVPAHAADADPSPLWISWLTRARAREAGMASASFTAAYLTAYRDKLDAFLLEQSVYHHRASHRNHLTAHRLHRAGTALFLITFLTCVAHLGVEVWHHAHASSGAEGGPLGLNGALTLLAAALPAFGAAAAGIASQGEFERSANKSRSMQRQLQTLRNRLAMRAPSSDSYGDVADDAVAVMSEELLEWQATFRTKPLNLPA